MYWMLVVVPGLLSLAVGFFLIRRPEVLVKAGTIANRIVMIDHVALAHRKYFGSALIVAGIALLLVAAKVAVR